MNGEEALQDDLSQARGLRGLSAHFGPEEPLPPDLVEHALDALPDEGDRLVRALKNVRGREGPAALPFCGRKQQLEQIYDAVRDAVAERHLHVIEIVGERGLGKTRVFAEALAIIDPETRGIDVLPLAVAPGDGPQALLTQLVRRRFDIAPRQSDQAAYDQIIEALEPLFDERNLVAAARLLGHLAGLRAMGPGADALPADLEAFRRHAFKALVTVFRHDLTKSPRILVLQRPGDIHPLALDLLMSLVSDLAGEPLVLVVLNEGQAAASTLSDALPDEGARFTRVQVTPLAEREVRRLVRSLFADPDAEPSLVESLVERARGIPRLVLENARLLVQREVLVKTDDGLVRNAAGEAPAVEATLAGDLEEASRLRVSSLSPLERGFLQSAAVFGRAFDPDGAVAVAAAHEPGLFESRQTKRVLARLRASGLVRPTDSRGDEGSGSPSWRFSHHADRARLLAELSGEVREILHALVAQWLDSRPAAGHDAGVINEAIAAHWLRAHRRSEAARALIRAGEAARDGLALPRAKALMRTALEALGLHQTSRGLDRAPLVQQVALTYADLCLKTGDFHDARILCAAALEAAQAIAPQPPSERASTARAWLLFGRAHRGLGAYSIAKAALERAARLSRRAADAHGSGDILTEMARVHWLAGGEGGYAEALRLLGEALEVRRGLGEPRAIGEALGLMANIHIQRGEYEEARAPLEEAGAVAREAFDLAAEARAMMALGAIAYFGGDLDRALEVWKDGLRVAETAGERELIGAFLNNLGETRLARGELDHAAAALLEAREMTTETGDLRTLADVLKNLSALYARRGDLVRAQATADEAYALATAMQARPSLGPALRARAEVRSLRALGEGSEALASEAEADFREAIAIFADLGDKAELERTESALANHLRLVPKS